jgi:biopolymer transport protein TolR
MAIGGPRQDRVALAEINVTPMVDVMLVLLIIFMVSAPMMTRGIEVGLPKAVSGEEIDEKRLTVTVDRKGQYFVDSQPVVDAMLVQEVRRRGGDSPGMAVYLQGDAGVDYGRVLAAMDALRVGGIDRVALVTQPAPPEPPARRGR